MNPPTSTWSSTPAVGRNPVAPATLPATIRVPRLANDRHAYFVTLLTEALKAIGKPMRVELVSGLTQPQMWQMLASGELGVLWGGRTTERDRHYLRIDNRATNGIACMRLVMVRKGLEDSYASVDTLDEFRALNKIGGAGEGWLEVQIWQQNRLPLYVQAGNWNELFGMIAKGDRRVDYITRAAHEAILDLKQQPELAVVPRIMLMHDRDMRFYVSPRLPALQPVVDQALMEAERSGLKKSLVEKLLLEPLAELNLNRRIRLRLATPAT